MAGYYASVYLGEELSRVAALFVEEGGVYYGLPDVDPWPESRDARLYAGPWPVVAHPPCARWSRLAGFVEFVHGYKRGDDGGCFAAALDAVHAYGGVLEHPAYSSAWDHFGLPEPLTHGEWTGGITGGFSAYVEQGRYGLPTKKATWLYAFGCALPELEWGYTPDGDGTLATNQDPQRGGIHAWRDQWRSGWWNETNKPTAGANASRTPLAFRDVLLGMARSAGSNPLAHLHTSAERSPASACSCDPPGGVSP